LLKQEPASQTFKTDCQDVPSSGATGFH